MKPNRSIPQSTVIPVLIYPDVRDAVAWLTSAFGFEPAEVLHSPLTTHIRYRRVS